MRGPGTHSIMAIDGESQMSHINLKKLRCQLALFFLSSMSFFSNSPLSHVDYGLRSTQFLRIALIFVSISHIYVDCKKWPWHPVDRAIYGLHAPRYPYSKAYIPPERKIPGVGYFCVT